MNKDSIKSIPEAMIDFSNFSQALYIPRVFFFSSSIWSQAGIDRIAH